jgi:hypothetical protein
LRFCLSFLSKIKALSARTRTASLLKFHNSRRALARFDNGHGRPVHPSGAKPREPELKLPSDAEIDKVISFLEKVWRRS